MIYGRQPTILHRKPLAQILPQAVDDVYIHDGREQPDGIPSMNAFLRSTVQLYLTMDDITEILQTSGATGLHGPSETSHDVYVSAARPSLLEILTAILKSDELLLSWYNSLPDFLRFRLDYAEQYDSSLPRWIQRHKTILKNRFLGLRILLHRQTILFLLQPLRSTEHVDHASYHWPPLFSDFFHQKVAWDTSVRPQSDVERPLAYLSAQICVQSAQQQIDTTGISRPINLTGAWWWDFHCKQYSSVIL
jgi:hypothetical protein